MFDLTRSVGVNRGSTGLRRRALAAVAVAPVGAVAAALVRATAS
ncbi:MAG: hypothetical protein ACQSGP_30690 [Frankia sp.]